MSTTKTINLPAVGVILMLLFIGCSGTQEALLPPDTSSAENPRNGLEAGSGRALLDAYEITLNVKTGEVETSRARNALMHYDVT